MRFKLVAGVLGAFLTFLGLIMLLPAFFSLYYREPRALAGILVSAGITIAAGSILWIQRMSGRRTEVAGEPGEGVKGYPRAAAVALKTLRDLQGLAVRDRPVGHWARQMPPFKRLREVPAVTYRVYRHTERITASNLHHAELVGEVDALGAYQNGFIHIDSHGEYYAPRERGDSIIPTWRLGKDRPVLPGEAYFVHTPQRAGRAYYAVTAAQDGAENVARFGEANSLPVGLAEASAQPRPVLQFVTVNKTRYGNGTATEFWYAYWLSPPYSNMPDNRPRRIVMAFTDAWTTKLPGAMSLGTSPSMGPGWKVMETISSVSTQCGVTIHVIFLCWMFQHHPILFL